jgi:hypothetical protein
METSTQEPKTASTEDFFDAILYNDFGDVEHYLDVLEFFKDNHNPVYGKKKDTPLILACQIGNVEMVKYLMDTEKLVVDINYQNTKGLTALMYVVNNVSMNKESRTKIVELFLNSPSLNIGLKDEVGDTAFGHLILSLIGYSETDQDKGGAFKEKDSYDELELMDKFFESDVFFNAIDPTNDEDIFNFILALSESFASPQNPKFKFANKFKLAALKLLDDKFERWRPYLATRKQNGKTVSNMGNYIPLIKKCQYYTVTSFSEQSRQINAATKSILKKMDDLKRSQVTYRQPTMQEKLNAEHAGLHNVNRSYASDSSSSGALTGARGVAGFGGKKTHKSKKSKRRSSSKKSKTKKTKK